MTSALTEYLGQERGRLTKLAETLGINRITIYRWTRSTVPAERIVELERATGIPRRHLRPDLFDERSAP